MVFFLRLTAAFCALVGLTVTPVWAAEDASNAPDLGWGFEVALGGSLSTGNTDRQALDLDSKARFRNARREDRWRLLGNLARENGSVTANRVEGSAQTNVNLVDSKLYLLGFAEGRRDQFSGYRYETSLGPGLGYRLIDTDRMTFSLEFATGYRHGELRGPGNDDDVVFARGTVTTDYQISTTAKLTNELLATGDKQRLRVEDTFSVTSTLISDIAMRASFNARYVSNPPVGIKKLDTLTKVALVYTF